MRLLKITTAAACAVALSGSIATAGKLTPTANTSRSIYVPTGGNQPGVTAPYQQPAVSTRSHEGRSAKKMKKPSKKMMMKDTSGTTPGGAKPGVGGMGSPSSK